MSEDYYRTIQIHPECDAVIIPEMRKVWAKIIHPDKARTESSRIEWTEKLKKINNAIDFLSNPQKRNDYNKKHPYFVNKTAGEATPEPEAKPKAKKKPASEKETNTGAGYSYKSDINSAFWKYLDGEILFNIAKEARVKNKFEPFDRKTFYNFGQRIVQNKKFTKWQSENFGKYIVMAQKAGLV